MPDLSAMGMGGMDGGEDGADDDEDDELPALEDKSADQEAQKA